MRSFPSTIKKPGILATSVAAALLVVAVQTTASGATNTFKGTGTTTWDVFSDWSNGTLPISTDALEVTSSSLNAGTTETLDAPFTVQSLSVDIGSSSFSINADASGTAGQTLTLSSGTDALGATSSLVDLSATTTGTVNIGVAGGVGTTTVALGGSGNINVGNSAATLDFGANSIISGVSGSALTKTGAGTLIFAGANTYAGSTTVSGGALTFSGAGSSTGAGSLTVSGATGSGVSAPVLNLNSSGTVTFNGTVTLGSSGAAGAIYQTSGTFNAMNNTAYLSIGGTGYGFYSMSGGTLNTTSASGIRVGAGSTANGQGVFLQSGGIVNVTRFFAVGEATGTSNPASVATFTGGTLNGSSGFAILVGDNASGNGVLNLGTEVGGTGTIVSNAAAGFEISDNATSVGVANLNSGTLKMTAGSINKVSTGTGTLNLNGGTIQAGANSLTLIGTTLNSVNVYNGGVTIDTQTNTSTVSANLLKTNGNGVYANGGAGTLAMSGGGGTGYVGAPLVTVTGGSGTGATAIANISGGVVTGVTLTNPGQNYAVGDTLTFAFSGGGDATAATNYQYVLTSNDLAANTAGEVTKIGTGTLLLSGTNTYTGATKVNAGVLQISNNSAVPVASTITVASGATFDTNANGQSGTNVLQISGTGASGQLGAIVNSNSAAEGSVSNVTLLGDAAVGGPGGKLDFFGTISGAHTLTAAAGSTAVDVRTLNAISGLTGFNVNCPVISEASQNWAGTYTVNSGGALGGFNNISYSGAVTLNGGTLFANGTGFTTTFGGPLSVQSASTIGSTAINAGSTHGGSNITISNSISGNGGVTFGGATTTNLSVTNSYAGGTIINGTTTVVAGATNVLGTGGLAMSGGTFNLSGNNTAVANLSSTVTTATIQNASANAATLAVGSDGTSTTYSSILTDGTGGGKLALSKNGIGKLSLSGANTYTGATAVNAGTLNITGSITNSVISVNNTGTLSGTGTISNTVTAFNGGTIAPGVSAPGLLTVNSAVDFNSSSTLSIQLGGTGAGQTSQLSADGINLNADGGSGAILQLSLANGYIPQGGDLLVLALNSGAESGTFAGTGTDSNPAYFGGAPFTSFFSGGHEYAVSYSATSTSFTGGTGLAVEAVPEPGSATSLLGGFGMLATLWRFRRRRA